MAASSTVCNIGPDFNGYLEGAPNNFQQLQELFAKKYPGAELAHSSGAPVFRTGNRSWWESTATDRSVWSKCATRTATG